MSRPFARRFALAKRTPDARGLVCDDDGLMLGEAPLVVPAHDASGRTVFRAARPEWIADVLAAAYGSSFDAALARRLAQLDGIAKALGEGQLAEAAIRAVHLSLPALTADAAARLRLLRKYSSDQPRDWHGRWTNGTDAVGSRQSQIKLAGDADLMALCVERCYQILERKKPYKWSDKNEFDFRRCLNECREQFGRGD